MALLAPKADIRCAIRGQPVRSTPEEQVRQGLLSVMITELGYPQSLLCVEKSLKELPHIALTAPNRRADILCFAANIHPQYALYPLLLVECKATALTLKIKRQLTGYNRYIAAPYVCLANASEIFTGWFDVSCNCYQFTSGLPSYSQLLEKL